MKLPLFLAIALIGALAGCGGAGGSDSATPPATSDAGAIVNGSDPHDAGQASDSGRSGGPSDRDDASLPSGADSGGAADAPSAAWPGLRVSGTKFVDGTGSAFLPRGIGVGEWHNIESYMLDVNLADDSPGMGETELRAKLAKAMGDAGAEQFFQTWEANVVTEADVVLWASWGVNSVRLPMNYHALTSADGTYLEAGFDAMDQFIAWCKTAGIYVILDLHAAPGAQNCEEMSDSPDGVAHLWKEPATYRAWTIDLWQTIAKRYAGETAVGGYDIFDEPYDTEKDGTFSTGIGTLRQMYLDITSAIRVVDPNHILFFEGTGWSTIDPSSGGLNGFEGLTPAWDPQMAWAFHKYWDDNTTAAIQGYLDLRTSSNRPVWNGETGEDEKTGWSAAMIALLEANDIGWNEWTYKKVAQSEDFYSIAEPSSWSAMQTYLQGGAMPSQADANTIMLALAANAATTKSTLEAAWLKEVFDK